MSDDVIYRRCNRCGGMMELPKPQVILMPDDEEPDDLKDWKAIRDGASVAHQPGKCPHELEAAAEAAIGKHSYRVEVVAYRDGEEVARVGGERDAVTFKEVADSFLDELGSKFRRVVAMASVIDSDLQGGDDDAGASGS